MVVECKYPTEYIYAARTKWTTFGPKPRGTYTYHHAPNG